ncbi:thiosulfate oxidation carrier protein SoxY [Congregibacter litoralis]|uniref:Thiosulfate-binding protein SoxY n=1 Tax=Congregibacter litoralis KT71 TaxID=314285 RepID=A4A7K5_9GAMM|nr:thiosulfate oxidation carrier protein SoxY [Congregibacter litoralis]EAQ98274.2 thiosulfate-binding protein SoxY [Congregibacter litoralis KT71]
MQGTLTRRRFGQAIVAFAALATLPLQVFARSREAFKAVKSDEAITSLFGDKPVTESDDFEFKVPDIAEDGSIVPVTVSTDMEGVKSIALLVDANPNPLSARFHFMPGAVPEFKTRIKMGESSDVRAVIETADALYVATKNVKVTLGGCGG